MNDQNKLSVNSHTKGGDVVVSYTPLGQPLSYFSDDRWISYDYKIDLSFDNLYSGFKKECKYLVFEIINDNNLINIQSYSSKYIQAFSIFCRCIWECGGRDFGYINSDSGFRRFVEVAKSKKLRYKTWKNYLVLIPLLYERGVITRKIENADKLAHILSKDNGDIQQTIALPENIASAYFKAALDVVSKFHPYSKMISGAYDSFWKDYQDNIDKGLSVPIARSKAQKLNESFLNSLDMKLDLKGEWLSWLRGACYIVIAGFTGCRDGEIKSFTKHSYKELKYADKIISIVEGKHTKPNVAGVSRNVSWVTIPAVKDAIELIWNSYDFARLIWDERASHLSSEHEKDRIIRDLDSLFLQFSPTATRPRAGRQAIDKSLRSFVRSVDYRATSQDVKEFNLLNPSRKGELTIGEILVPNPHCFRRTFAVYLVRNKLASLLDLKHQFKHMNIAMTSWYANQSNVAGYSDMMLDEELKADIAKENHEFMTDTLYYIYNEAESLSGVEGKRIQSLRDGNQSTIYMSREEISQQVRNGQLSIIETPVGHCTNPQCNRLCDTPACKYEVVTKDKAILLATKREQLISKFKSLVKINARMPNIMSKLYYEIKTIELCLNDHNIAYETFTHNINQTVL
ncbi:site-specific integrase [Vibrio metschnikovii]|uniref:site-specific integrase n=1 Tax=Vibrio metschnikovii TaxID=28172 RepID=UPI0020C67536|nr:site-specific integrase [Vibrio metschnikovii]